MANTTKQALATLDQDFGSTFNERCNAAKQQLSQVRTANLEGPDRHVPTKLTERIDGKVAEFQQAKVSLQQELAPQREALAKKAQTLMIVFWIALALGVVLTIAVSAARAVGVLIVIVAVIYYFIAKAITAKPAASLAQRWQGMFAQFAADMGDRERLHSPASGIYQEVDQLFLKSLDDQARGFELQQRKMQQQMDAQQEAHEQAMEAQRQQAEAMQQMVKEQKRTNRMLR